jgi:succinate-semialdehyde dehydrogenase / glutarate-semialdehyde dehydrogenase
MTMLFDAKAPELLRQDGLQVEMHIGGQWLTRDETFEVFDPATRQPVAEVPEATKADVGAAVGAASTAFSTWRQSTPDDRRRLLNETARLIDRDADYLAALITLETGKPLAESRHEVDYTRDFAVWYGEEARRLGGYTLRAAKRPGGRLHVTRHPLGVVVALIPWNYPLVLLGRKLFAALAAGNTVVVKPSERTPLASAHLIRLLEEAQIPDGVVNYVTASDGPRIGAALLADRRVAHVSFTGSVEGGRAIARRAAEHLIRVSLELGGHNPFIVLSDCDVFEAAAAAAHARLRNGGQTCVSPNRVYVERRVYEDFVEAYVTRLTQAVVGDGFDPATTIGPMISEAGAEKVERHIADALKRGAELRCGGDRVVQPKPGLEGCFLRPAVLTKVSGDMAVLKEETFGPVAPVIPFDTVDEAVAWANDSDYGLAAYVYTDSLRTANRLIEEIDAGMVVVNQPSGSGVQAPQGGIKQSGFGLEGGREGLEEFTYQKYVSV